MSQIVTARVEHLAAAPVDMLAAATGVGATLIDAVATLAGVGLATARAAGAVGDAAAGAVAGIAATAHEAGSRLAATVDGTGFRSITAGDTTGFMTALASEDLALLRACSHAEGGNGFAAAYHRLAGSERTSDPAATAADAAIIRDSVSAGLRRLEMAEQSVLTNLVVEALSDIGFVMQKSAGTAGTMRATAADGRGVIVKVEPKGRLVTDFVGFRGRDCTASSRALFEALNKRGVRVRIESNEFTSLDLAGTAAVADEEARRAALGATRQQGRG